MKLADKAIFNILCQSSGTIILLLSSILYVRMLTQQDYGTFLQVMLISNTVLMLGFLGIPQSIYYFFQTESDKDHFLTRTLFLTLAVSVFFAVLVWVIKKPLVALFGNPDLNEYYWVILVLVLLGFMIRLREPLLWSNGSLMTSGNLTIVSSVLQLGLPVLGLFRENPLYAVLLLMVIGNCLSIILHLLIYIKIIFRIRRQYPKSRKPVDGKSGLLKQLRYAFPIGLSSYVGVIGREMDKYFISSWFTPAQFAVYSRGAMEVPLVSNIRFTINDIMMPQFVALYQKGDIKGLLQQWHMITEQIAKLNFGIFALLFAVTPTLIRVLYTEAYMGAASVFRIYLFLLVSGIAVYGMIPRVSGQTKLIFWSAVMNLPINFTLSLLLIKVVGVKGPALGSVIAAIVVLVWLLYNSTKIIKVSFSEIMPWKKLLRYLAVSLAISGPIYLTEYFYPPDGAFALIQVALESFCYVIAYLYALNRLGYLTDEERTTICRWSRPIPLKIILKA